MFRRRALFSFAWSLLLAAAKLRRPVQLLERRLCCRMNSGESQNYLLRLLESQRQDWLPVS